MDHASFGTFSKGRNELREKGVGEDVKIVTDGRRADTAFTGDILKIDDLTVAEGGNFKKTVECWEIAPLKEYFCLFVLVPRESSSLSLIF